MIDLHELEKGLVCLVPKNPGPDCMLPSCHEYSVCDCKVLELISEIRKLREVNSVMREALEELFIPYNAYTPAEMPRFPHLIIDEALTKAAKIMGDKE
jgi:hypothetical protein